MKYKRQQLITTMQICEHQNLILEICLVANLLAVANKGAC